MTKLSITLLLLFAALAGLIYATILMIGTFLSSLLFSQLCTMLGCFVLLGIGAGFPIVLLATVLGWVQLVLLLSGNINPHLAQESFFGVLKTLFSKM